MYNKAILIGRLVADPELRTTPNGTYVATFRIAVDRAYQQKGAEKKADFLSIVAWRQQGEFVKKYFFKGKAIGVEGSIQNRDYTDRDGNKRYVTEIIADRVFFVGDKSGGQSGDTAAVTAPQLPTYGSGSPAGYTQPAPQASPPMQQDYGNAFNDDDDLPF